MSEGGSDDGPTGDGGRDEPFGDLKRRLQARSESGDGATDRVEHAGVADRDGITDTDRGGVTDADDTREGSGARGADAGVGGGADELFEEMDVTDVDADRVWESVLDDADDGDGASIDPAAVGADKRVGTDDTADAADADEGHVVRKRDHCESCEFFTAPPEVACTDEDGEIVEVVDSERFRVRNCPVVAGRIDTDGTALDASDGNGSVVDGFE
ncbi:hypothetical protein [Salinigranum marinum]|uniref:hypothetical protein n=1 Tax=Salinigranum marinum TaxID=1515595 RepID=UPI00298A0553|nr:hypothetical protein [Salinigranum marinum]